MSETRDGGSAFPQTTTGFHGVESIGGMTLRDYFAGQAMAGFMAQSHAGPKDWTKMGHGWGEDCANSLNKHEKALTMTLAAFAYQVADALLAARTPTS